MGMRNSVSGPKRLDDIKAWHKSMNTVDSKGKIYFALECHEYW